MFEVHKLLEIVDYFFMYVDGLSFGLVRFSLLLKLLEIFVLYKRA